MFDPFKNINTDDEQYMQYKKIDKKIASENENNNISNSGNNNANNKVDINNNQKQNTNEVDINNSLDSTMEITNLNISLMDLEDIGVNTISAIKLAAAPAVYNKENIQTKEIEKKLEEEEILELKSEGINTENKNGEEKITNKKEKAKKLTKEELENRKASMIVLREKVDGVQIKLIMDMFSADSREDNIRNKYKMPWGDNVSTNGQRWYNHNRSKGGVGAVSLTKHALANLDGLNEEDDEVSKIYFKKAINWLAKELGEQVNDDEIKATVKDLQLREKKPFSAPFELPNQLDLVKNYLVFKRGLPESLIDKCIKEGKIYAGTIDWMVDDKNKTGKYPEDKVFCVFMAQSKMTAECRCIKDEGFSGFTKGFATGSKKRQFGFTVKHDIGVEEKVVTMVEGAIDALSYHALYPGRFAISLGGCDNMELMVAVAKQTLEKGWKLGIGLDNDKAGEQTTELFRIELIKTIGEEKFNEYSANKKIARHKPKNTKDWNEELKFMKNAKTLKM